MKDNFSHSSDKYAQFRPTYPKALYDFLLSKVRSTERAWDCGTGNGQVAAVLSQYFKEVYATDISENQLKQALPEQNVFYSVQDSAHATFAPDMFDLILVAQAIHWFNFEAFYSHVYRTARQGAIFAAIGYGLIEIDAATNAVISRFYNDITGPYWDAERKYIDDEYRSIPFPFDEIPAPKMSIETNWNLVHLLGFFRTWSAVRHYQLKNGSDPLLLIEYELKEAWGNDEMKKVNFPLLLRVGTVNK